MPVASSAVSLFSDWQSARNPRGNERGKISSRWIRQRFQKRHDLAAFSLIELDPRLKSLVQGRQHRVDRRGVVVVQSAQGRLQLRDVVIALRRIGVRVMSHDGFERRVCAVVHVWSGELDVAQRRYSECELIERRARKLFAASDVPRRRGTHAGADLRYADVGELLTTEQR